ncbi:MAG: transcriptional regulator GcvA [Gammaproteobacteria bacterium]|uniref:transcriptional regulator GcvA n=1 Tax=Azohydromonas sp. TaxID=1872666 RepID=UPI002BD9AA41|nr:transcriptional regulator GcvA [Azohydromonas sp.]HMM86341.1 transcriptional regulator GcvA [Azohydromonas sp.]
MARRPYHLPPLAPLEAFEAAARHLSFTRAADELALTQSAISRQIQALEAHYGVPLFQRLHRALRLTPDGELLQRVVVDVLQQLHATGQALQRAARPKTVVVTTTPGFAGLWLIPRLGSFTAAHPGVDVRISATHALLHLERDGIDVAIRYDAAADTVSRLFGEVVFPVCSPRLLGDPARPLAQPQDLRHHVLLALHDEGQTPYAEWPLWLRAVGLERLQPAGTLHHSLYDQLIQAAVNGHGVALGRSPLVDALIDDGRLVAPFDTRHVSPRSYHVLTSDAGAARAEVQAFVAWLHAQAGATAPGPGS